ncbi:FAD-dependent oxidoreductase [Roseibacterium sp. SDUM158017]|uniref:FAD-dependent oxidoreductase n=1 Tax=Roseicyclus salinarum TaxID=3036773 RepID=UPI00241556EF|nr:FAD-dependent oxidoreductase [Roseibacterium sp. SDUM158017]MDG4647881.1 FAD-dependent oxidoreductase [Roseibacterium sp. SDUM158017]
MKDTRFDVVVVGAGAAGMTAAATAAAHGLDVIVVEKTGLVGGNTSYSGGMVYVPCNDKMAEAGHPDDFDRMMAYLDAAVPTDDGRAARERFVRRGPEAVRFLEANTAVRLKPVPFYPDYYPEFEGAAEGMRVLEPLAFDAATLGDWFRKLRPPLPEFTILGGMMIAREDIPHFRKMWRSPRSFARATRLVLEYLLQRTRHHRGSRLVLGNALAGRLLKSLLDLGVEIRTDCAVEEVVTRDVRATGLRVRQGDVTYTLHAEKGVILSTGGFSNSAEKRRDWLPDLVSPDSPFAPGSTGDGLDLGVAAGGKVGTDNTNNAYWSPASVYTRKDGRKVVYPHTVTDRGKPGSVVVNAAGRRFTNEAVSYHRFGEALLQGNAETGNLPAWIICDADFIWKYGLGAIIPFTRNLKPYHEAGYLRTAESLPALARKLGIDEAGFAATMERFNADAERGQDTEFHRGEDVYSRYLGDADHRPNPCLAPLRKPPFHAIELTLSDLGTVAGLRTTEDCEVIGADGRPIGGLYAVGNDMQSIMRGRYPGPGITLGPALTFGYLAGLHVAGKEAGS